MNLKFKIGDRVIIKSQSFSLKNVLGEIVSIRSNNFAVYPYEVKTTLFKTLLPLSSSEMILVVDPNTAIKELINENKYK